MSPAPAHTYCQFHCSTCGQHFTSLRAFDAHRAFLGEPDDWDERGCLRGFEVVHRDGTQRLEHVDGECRIGKPAQRGPGQVWRLLTSDQERERLAKIHA